MTNGSFIVSCMYMYVLLLIGSINLYILKSMMFQLQILCYFIVNLAKFYLYKINFVQLNKNLYAKMW